MLGLNPIVVVRDAKMHFEKNLERLVRVSTSVLVYAAVDAERNEIHIRAFAEGSGSAAAAAPRRVTILEEPADNAGGAGEEFWTKRRIAATQHKLSLAQHAWEGTIAIIELFADDWGTSTRSEARQLHLLIGTTTGCFIWCDAVEGRVVCVAAPTVDVTARGFDSAEPLASSLCGVVSILVGGGAVAPTFSGPRGSAAPPATQKPCIFIVFSNGNAFEICSQAVEEVGATVARAANKGSNTPVRVTLRDWDPSTSTAPFPIAGIAAQPICAGITTRFAVNAGGGPQSVIFSCALCGRVATEILDVLDGTMDNERSILTIGTSPAFASFTVKRDVAVLSAAQVVGEVAARITGAAMGLVKGLWRGSSSPAPSKPAVKPLPQSRLPPRVSLLAADITFSSIAVDPSLTYAACYATTGRIYIVDLIAGAVWKVFKGCRSAQFQWVTGACDAKKMLCLVILLPLRRVLEVHGLKSRHRVAAVALQGDCKLVPPEVCADPSHFYLSHNDGSLSRWSLVTLVNPPGHALSTSQAAALSHHQESSKSVVPNHLIFPVDQSDEVFLGFVTENIRKCTTAEQVFALVMAAPLETSSGAVASRAKLHALHDLAAEHLRKAFSPSATDAAVLPSVATTPKTAAQVLNFVQLRNVLTSTLVDLVDRYASATPANLSLTSLSHSDQQPQQSRRSVAALASRLRRCSANLQNTLDPLAAAQLRRLVTNLSSESTPGADKSEERTAARVDFATVASFFWSGGYKNRFLADVVHASDLYVSMLGGLLFTKGGVEALSGLSRPLSTLGITSVQGAQLAMHWACIASHHAGLASSTAEAFCSVASILSADELMEVLLGLRLHLRHQKACVARIEAAVAVLLLWLDSTSSLPSQKRVDLTVLLARFLHLARFVSESAELSGDENVAELAAPVLTLGSIAPYGRESLSAFIFQKLWASPGKWPKNSQPISPQSPTLLAVLGLAEAVVSLDCHAAGATSDDGAPQASTPISADLIATMANVKQQLLNEMPGSSDLSHDFSILVFCGIAVAASCAGRFPLVRSLRDATLNTEDDLEIIVSKFIPHGTASAGRSRLVGRYVQLCRDLCEFESDVVSSLLFQSPRGSELLRTAPQIFASFESMDREKHVFPFLSLRAHHAAAHLSALLGGGGGNDDPGKILEALFERRAMIQLLQWKLSHPHIRVGWHGLFPPSVFAPLELDHQGKAGSESPGAYVAQREKLLKDFCSTNPPPTREDAEALRVLLGVGTSDLVALEFFEKAAVDGNVAEMRARVSAVSNRVALAKVALRLLHDFCRAVLKETLAASSRLQQSAESGSLDKAAKAARIQAASMAQRVEGALTGPVLAWVRGKSAFHNTSHADPATQGLQRHEMAGSNRHFVAAIKAALHDGAEGKAGLRVVVDTAHFLASVCAAEGSSFGDTILTEIALELPGVLRNLAKILLP